MNTIIRAAMVAAIALATLPQLAAAQGVSEARARCSALKQQVRALENAGSSQVSSTRREWERACAYASSLMNPSSRSTQAAFAPASAPVDQPTRIARQATLAAPMRVSALPSAGPLMHYSEKLSPESTAVFRGHRFKVTILDPSDEASRLAPPTTRPVSVAPLHGKPVPLF